MYIIRFSHISIWISNVCLLSALWLYKLSKYQHHCACEIDNRNIRPYEMSISSSCGSTGTGIESHFNKIQKMIRLIALKFCEKMKKSDELQCSSPGSHRTIFGVTFQCYTVLCVYRYCCPCECVFLCAFFCCYCYVYARLPNNNKAQITIGIH